MRSCVERVLFCFFNFFQIVTFWFAPFFQDLVKGSELFHSDLRIFFQIKYWKQSEKRQLALRTCGTFALTWNRLLPSNKTWALKPIAWKRIGHYPSYRISCGLPIPPLSFIALVLQIADCTNNTSSNSNSSASTSTSTEMLQIVKHPHQHLHLRRLLQILNHIYFHHLNRRPF